jgi:hypothetical protein
MGRSFHTWADLVFNSLILINFILNPPLRLKYMPNWDSIQEAKFYKVVAGSVFVSGFSDWELARKWG